MITKIVEQLLDLRTPAIITITFTAIIFVICLVKFDGFDLSGRYSKTLGLFVGLSRRSALHLCFAWCKYIYFASILCSMQYATLGHYLIIAVLIVVSAFMAKEAKLIVMESVGGLLCLASTWVCSIFVDYMTSVRSDLFVLGAYWIIVLFMIICSTVVFLYEVMSISRERELIETNIAKK